MSGTHQHRCSQCAAAWEHSEASNGRYPEHICPSCGFLELMVLKPGQPPMGAADYPQAVTNFLNVLSHSDPTVRAAAALSLGYLRAEPGRAVSALAMTAIGDPDPTVKQSAAEGLRRFGLETCRDSAGCLWPAIATIFEEAR